MTGLLTNKVKKLNMALLDENQEAKELVKSVIENIPEWERLLGCRQHAIHDYTLDVHTLLVIKKVREFENFEDLKEYDRLILLYAALLHDIEKMENEVDPQHPQRGAEASSAILFKLGFSEEFINRVYLLIKYHQILGLMGTGKIMFASEELADIYKDPVLLDLQTMLSIADIKSVKKNEKFFNKTMHEKIVKIVENVKTFM